MEPAELSRSIKRIAFALETGLLRDRQAAMSAVARLLVATDQSLALAIQQALFAKIQELVPGEFAELFDTAEKGKGYKAGYVSFGLQPASLQTEGILGGLLIRGKYDPKEFRSEKKDDSGPDFRHTKGGAALDVQLEACYYLKKLGEGCDQNYAVANLGIVTIAIDATEGVEEVEITNPGAIQAGIKALIADVQANPPDYAQSAERKRSLVAPTGSKESLENWLKQQGRSDVKQSEILALARAINQRTGKATGNAVQDITDYFRRKQWAIDPNG